MKFKILVHNTTFLEKVYPYFNDVFKKLKDQNPNIDFEITKLIKEDSEKEEYYSGFLKTSLTKLKEKIKDYDLIISIDSFLPHFLNTLDFKIPTIVIFIATDPINFGYSYNINLYKTKVKMRQNKFDRYYNNPVDNYLDPQVIIENIKRFIGF